MQAQLQQAFPSPVQVVSHVPLEPTVKCTAAAAVRHLVSGGRRRCSAMIGVILLRAQINKTLLRLRQKWQGGNGGGNNKRRGSWGVTLQRQCTMRSCLCIGVTAERTSHQVICLPIETLTHLVSEDPVL